MTATAEPRTPGLKRSTVLCKLSPLLVLSPEVVEQHVGLELSRYGTKHGCLLWVTQWVG